MDFCGGVPTIRALLREPLPGLRGSWLNRLLLRTILLTLRGRIREIEGLGHLAGVREPFILAANHTTYLEAFLVPVVLCFLRRGRRVRFLADWMFFLIPGISSLLRRAGIIPVRRKPARWRGLNRLKNLVVRGESGYRMALRCLRRNEVIGVYPEGMAHGSNSLLLRGELGAARLAVATGFPLLPLGIRFPGHRGAGPVATWEPFTLHFGEPILPPCTSTPRLPDEAL